MAKGKVYLAKVRFDDGTNKAKNGKAVDYAPGQTYMGDETQLKAALKKDLVLEASEYNKKSVVVSGDADLKKKVDELTAENSKLKAALVDSEKKVEELQEELDSIEFEEEEETETKDAKPAKGN